MADYNQKPIAMRTTLQAWLISAAIGVTAVLAVPVVSVVTEPVFGESNAGKAFAQRRKKKDDGKPKRKTRRTPAIRAKVFEKLTEAQEAAEAKDYKTALQVLGALRDKGGKGALNSYEIANLYNMYAFIYFTQEDYDNALRSYQTVIQQEDIPEAMEVNTRFTIAQLYFVKEDWRSGIRELNKWFAAKEELGEPIGANSYALRAQAYYQLKNFNAALSDIEYAVNNYKQKGKVPKEQWYGLMRFLHYDANRIDKVIEILEETLVYYQKKNYWVQLAAMYGDRKQETKMLAAMETAYVQGLLSKDKELINLGYMFLSLDAPYKAAKTVDIGLKYKIIEPTSKNLELLGNAWRQAQELKRAIPVMAEAAKKSDKGELWSRLGNIYLDNEEFQKASEAVEAGIKKGGLRREDTAWLVLGMAKFNLQEYDGARKAFKKAMEDERSEKYAKQWMQYMDREIARQKSLAADMEV